MDFRRHNAITIDDENNDILQLAAPSHAEKEEKINRKLIFHILKIAFFIIPLLTKSYAAMETANGKCLM